MGIPSLPGSSSSSLISRLTSTFCIGLLFDGFFEKIASVSIGTSLSFGVALVGCVAIAPVGSTGSGVQAGVDLREDSSLEVITIGGIGCSG